MLRRRMRWNFVVARAILLVCMMSGCTEGLEGPPAPPEGAISAENHHLTVVGTVPQSTRYSRSVVFLEPHTAFEAPVPAEAMLLDQLGRTFIPALLVVRVGQPVVIRNSENELHNVRVVDTATGNTLINIGMLLGATYQHTFTRAGIYTVQCDIHNSMFADIVATTTPYVAVSDREGHFSLSDVPVGDYTLTVLYGDRQIERVVEIGESGAPLVIDETVP